MNTFLSMIANADTIAILGHVSPDGDCVGSCMGLYNYIMEHYEKSRVQVYLESFREEFKFLSGADTVLTDADEEFVYDLCISLDCGDTNRHGIFGGYFQNAKQTICVDHHVSNQGFGDFCVVDVKASSASEAVYKLLEDDALSRNVAEAFYLGIVHDTGVFKHNCTSKTTMEIAGNLIALGARSDYVIDKTFYQKTFTQNKLLGRALSNACLELDGKVIVAKLTLSDFDECKASFMDTDGIVDQLRITEGVEVACFVYQKAESLYKFSLRSNSYVNVSEISIAMGGGGHVRAAGFAVEGDYDTAYEKIMHMMKAQLS